MLGLANVYKVRPSTLLDLTDPYTSYCFDEACAFIIQKMENKEEPVFRQKFSSFKEMYTHYTNK